MNISTIVMTVLAVAMIVVAYVRDDGSLSTGLKSGLDAFVEFAPLLVGVFVVVGMSQVLIPKELIARLLGQEAGIRGILLATGLGAITPGGPFVSFPLVATLYKSGADVGPMVAYVTAWSLWAVTRLPLEIGFVGLRPTVIRVASTLLFPPLAGLIASHFLENLIDF